MAIANVPIRLDAGNGWIDAVVERGTDDRKTLIVRCDGLEHGGMGVTGVMVLERHEDTYVTVLTGNPIGLEWR